VPQNEPHEKQVEKISEMANQVRIFALLGLKMAAMDKEELVKRVREQYDAHGEFLLDYPKAEMAAKLLLEFITCGQVRLAIALAAVEGEPPDDDPDGGEDFPEEVAA